MDKMFRRAAEDSIKLIKKEGDVYGNTGWKLNLGWTGGWDEMLIGEGR